MRTLNRPMFRMGGPIKEGVMHGIREPYRGGGKAALVGNPLYPSTMGREHHRFSISMLNPMNWKNIFTGAQVAKNPTVGSKAWGGIKSLFGKTAPVTKTVPRQGPPYNIPGGNVYSKGYPGGKVIGKNIGPGSAEVTEQVWTPKGWVARDPIYQIGRKAYEGRGWLGKPLKWAGKTIATPTGGLGLIYVGGQWLKSDGTPATDAEVNAEFNFKGGKKPGRGDAGMTYTDPEAAKKLAAKKRDERITNLLETMGYDAAKKDAVSKALIDASQIVSDRGTLDKKNITRELINPIIQATSKRLEKPEQLNEAVRLMMTKAEIEKEMNPLDSEVKRMQIAVAKKKLAGPNLQEAILAASKDGPPMGETLSGILRRTGVDSVVLPIKVGKNKDTLAVAREVIQNTWKNAATEPDKVVKPGIYVVKERIIEVKEDGSVNPLDV
jgi:hypothetical protein